jgi:hypothetical protein
VAHKILLEDSMNPELKTAFLGTMIAAVETIAALLRLMLAISTLVYILISLGLETLEGFLAARKGTQPMVIGVQAIALLPEQSSAFRPTLITPYELMNYTVTELRAMAQYQGLAVPRNMKKAKLLTLLK